MTLKRFLKASALALSFVVSAPTVAHADPITAAIVTWAGFTAGTTAFAVATFVVNTALYAAGSWAVTKAAKALGLMKSSVAERQASVVSLSLGEVPREAVVGLACVGGSLIDAWNHGGKYGTDYTTRRVALADHVLDALVGYYVDDAYYAFTANGVQPGFSDGALQLTFANATAAGALPPLYMLNAGVGLTSADRTPSVAEIWITTKFNDQVWVRGHPTLKFVVRGLKLYDPRFDPQFGYTGPNPQTWEDVASHRFSDNAAVARYNIQRGVYAVGHHGDPAHLLIGRGLSQDEAPASRIIAAANVCDELVDGAPRYRVGGVVSSSQPHIEVEEMFAAAMAGQIVQRDGGVEVEPGQAKPAVVTITDDDLVAGEAISFSEFTPDTDGGRVNTVVSRYVEPAQLFKDHSGAVLRDQADIVEDGGPREMTLPLMLVTFRGQADRCAEIARRAARLERRATIPLVPLLKAGRAAAEIEDGDIVAWQSNRYHQGATVRYRVESYGVDAGWRNILQLREMASSVFGQADPVEDRASPPPAPVPIDALALTGVTAEAITLPGEDSALPAVRLRWDAPVDAAVLAIRAEVRRVGETEIASTRTEAVNDGIMVATNGVAPKASLECRLVPIGDPSRPVLPSNWITISTSGVVAGHLGPGSPVVKRIDDIVVDVQGLIATYGSTEAAAVSAAAADTARALAETAKQGAIDAKNESAAQAVASQTARQGSETAAAASQSSAQTASAKADEAGQKASAAEVARAAAATERALAEAARTTAVGAADTATGASASAGASAALSARLGFGQAMNLNPVFSQGWTNGQLPPGWQDWFGAANGGDNKRAGIESDNGLFLTVAGGGSAESANRGVYQPSGVGALGTVQGGGWYVQELTVRLDSGSLIGAGMHLQHIDGAGNIIGSTNINCAGDQTVTGGAVGAGVVGQVYRYAVLIKATAGTKTFVPFAMAFWNGYHAAAVAKSVTFTKCLVRPATAGEIETGVARNGYGTMHARMTTEEMVRASETAALSVRQGVLEAKATVLPNLLRNSDFSQGMRYWTSGGGAALWTTFYDAAYGSLAGALGGIDGQTYFLISDLVRVYGNSTYTLSLNGDGGASPGSVGFYCSQFDVNGNYIAEGDGLGFTNFAGVDWVTRKSTTFTTRSDCVYLKVVVVKPAYANGNPLNAFVSRIMLNTGSVAAGWTDAATARDLAARVVNSEGALATVQGRQTAWAQKRVIAGSAEAFAEMMALDDNGNVTSAVNVGGKRIGLWNPVGGGWVEVVGFSDGKARFGGDVAIAGNLIVDGTVNGRSALARDTVTPLAATYSAGILTLDGTTNTRLAEQIITTVGGPVVVNFNGLLIMQHEPAGSFDVTVEMRREKIAGDGVNDLQIVSETVAGAGNTADDFIGKWPVMIMDRPGAGTWRYVMNARVSASNMTRKDVLNRFMSAMELRSNN